MKRFLLLALAAGLLPALGGCANLQSLTRARAIERQIQVDRVRFAQNVGEAYQIISTEYRDLSEEADRMNQPEKAENYATRADIYDRFQKKMQQTADEIRARLQRIDYQGPRPEVRPVMGAQPAPAQGAAPTR